MNEEEAPRMRVCMCFFPSMPAALKGCDVKNEQNVEKKEGKKGSPLSPSSRETKKKTGGEECLLERRKERKTEWRQTEYANGVECLEMLSRNSWFFLLCASRIFVTMYNFHHHEILFLSPCYNDLCPK